MYPAGSSLGLTALCQTLPSYSHQAPTLVGLGPKLYITSNFGSLRNSQAVSLHIILPTIDTNPASIVDPLYVDRAITHIFQNINKYKIFFSCRFKLREKAGLFPVLKNSLRYP